jgi:uncharacterized membrane protein YdjX (TVP38/TMEM64 family)
MTARIKLILWVTLATTAILSMRWLTTSYDLNQMQTAIESYQWYFLLGYTLLIAIRGIFFIPTMPIILLMASTIEPWMLFVITLSATGCSSYLVCLAIDHFNVQKQLGRLPEKSVKRAQKWVNSYGVAAIVGWAFFPLIFTELIVYLARLSGLSKKRIVAAIVVGEGLLIWLLISVTEWLSALIA